MISHHAGWKFTLGFLVALGLVSAPLGRFFLPMFQWFLISSRDVMLVVFICIGFGVVAAMAWHLSPAYSWAVLAYLVSAVTYGFEGVTLANAQVMLFGTLFLVLLVTAWPTHRDAILFAVLIGLVLNLATAAMQYFVTDLGWHAPAGLVFRDPFFAMAAHVREIEGLASHYSLLIGFLVVAIPLVLMRWPRAGWLCVPPVVLLINHANHRSGALALLTLLILIPARRVRYGLLTAILAFAAVTVYWRGAFDTWNTFSGERFQMWTITLAKALQKPLLGWGPGTFSLWRPTLVHEQNKWGLTFLQAHNEYLQLIFEVGLVGGGIALLLWVGWLAWSLYRARPWSYDLRCAIASVLALGLVSFVSFPFRIGMTAVGGIVTLAALHGELRSALTRDPGGTDATSHGRVHVGRHRTR